MLNIYVRCQFTVFEACSKNSKILNSKLTHISCSNLAPFSHSNRWAVLLYFKPIQACGPDQGSRDKLTDRSELVRNFQILFGPDLVLRHLDPGPIGYGPWFPGPDDSDSSSSSPPSSSPSLPSSESIERINFSLQSVSIDNSLPCNLFSSSAAAQ